MTDFSEKNLRFLLKQQSDHDCQSEIQLLIQFMIDNNMTEELKKLLRLAVEENNQHIVGKLLHYADRETRDLLMIFGSAGSGNDEILMMLIRAGANIFRKQFMTKMNFVHLLGLNNRVHMIQHVFDIVREKHPEQFNEYLNGVDINGFTPLICAVQNNSEEATRLLLENGAQVHIADTELRSAIWFACSNGNIDIVRILVEYGANVNQCSISGKSPRFMALVIRAHDVAQFISEKGGLIKGPNIPQMADIDMDRVFKDEDIRNWLKQSFRSIESQADPPAKIWSDIASIVLDPSKNDEQKLSFISTCISKYEGLSSHSGYSWNIIRRYIASIAVHGIPKTK
jgi:ankyrin repeat protein